jgi:hypothetical protein
MWMLSIKIKEEKIEIEEQRKEEAPKREIPPISFPSKPVFNPPIGWHDLEINQIYYETYFEGYIKQIVDWLNESPINKNYLSQLAIQEGKKTKKGFIEGWEVVEENLDRDKEKEIVIVISVNSAKPEVDQKFKIPWKKPFIIDLKENKYFLVSFPKKPRFSPPTSDLYTYAKSYFENYAKIIINWLNKFSINRKYLTQFLSQKEEDKVEEMQPYPEEWQLLEEDLDNDNEKELILVVSRVIGFGAALSRLFIIDSKENEYFLAAEKEYTTLLNIERIADINRDNWKEIVLFGRWCGASICGRDIYIIKYDSKEKVYKNLDKEIIRSEESYKLIKGTIKSEETGVFEDLDNDGILEIITWEGYKKREKTHIYKWNGKFYVHSKTILDPPEYLIDAIYDANELLLKKEYQKAISLYKEIIYENKYKTVGDLTGYREGGEKEKKHLTAFARFRLIFIHLLLKEEDQAKRILEEIKKTDSEHICTIFSQILWENYQNTKDIHKSCKEITTYAKENQKKIEEFFEYFSGRFYGRYDLPYEWDIIEDICPIKFLES